MTSSHRVYFVDTSYLLELYVVPGYSDPGKAAAVRERRKGDWHLTACRR